MDPRRQAKSRRPAPCRSPARAPLPLTSAAEPVAPARPGLDRRGAREPVEARASTWPTRTPAGASSSPVAREWTRIGRSLAADVRFDDATVSRRHALIVAQADGVRVLDDRSLNGVYVNGRRVEWSPLADGDEIVVGRHTIHFMDTGVPARRCPRRRSGRRRRVGTRGSAGAARRSLVSCLDGRDDRGPVAQGRHGQDHRGPHAGRRLPADRARRPLRRPRSAGQPVGLLRRARRRDADGRRRALGRRQGQGGDARRDHPRDADPGRGRARAERQDGPRARPAQGAQGRAQAARPHPDRLPAGARPADDQRARRRRLGADLLRGAVLRAAGRQRGARGDRAGEGVLQRRPRVPRRRDEHRRHAHGALARGLRRRSRSTSATRSSTRSSAPSIAYAESAERAARSSTTGPTSAATTSSWPTRCSRARA